MKLKTFLTFFLLILSTTILFAGPGDTIVVQTIDFNTPVNPGWNSPREGKYLFPPDSVSFQKILMYYTLKCDPNQSPACGEWDYTTHTQLLYHTGEYDSNLYSHPNFIVNGGTPDTFMYMDQTSWEYFPYFEYFNSTNPLSTTQIGSGSSTTLLSLSGVPDARQAYLVRSDELLTAGMSAGDITGLRINFSAAGGYFSKFTIRVKATDSTELTPGSYVDDGLLTVYSRNTSFNTTGWNTIPFSFPFSWDGSSNLIIDLSFANHIPADQTMILADETAFNSGISSAGPDYFLDYEGTDGVDIPVDAFGDLDSMITVTLWQYGDPELQPQNNTIFEAVDHNNKRILNVHLPWSDSKVYWDAGNDGDGYDRLYRTASPEEFKGQWNHWAFVKDCHSGEMSVFLNGELWIFAYGKYKTMDSIVRFSIGASPNNKYYYDGYVDEFRVWNLALDQETIREWMFKEVDASHPDYENLLAYYKFTEGSGLVTADEITGEDAILKGYPGWMDYMGSNRFREFAQSNFRPQMIFEQGSYDPGSLDSLLTVDTLAQSQLMIVMYGDTLNPTGPTDTLSKWPSYYYNYVYDENGIATDSTLAPPDGILYREDHPYYGPPYEIIIKYELARFITPYGNGLSLGGGFTWIYDVTDFRPFLADSVHLQAGNFQELLDMKFYMIEGTPPRDVLNTDRMWHGYYKLSTFEQDVPPMTVNLDTNTSTYKLKITTSGHEFSNSTNCAEFCQKTHWVDVDNVTQYSWEIIDECATNALYPQGGTWIFDRAGWCPGAKVTERHLEITPFIAADSVILDYNCDYDPYGRYSVTSYLFSYGEPNFTLDAAVEDIMAPNKRKIFGRFNPMCGKPAIKIKNTGSTPLTSLDIMYGPDGGVIQTFHWTGSLEFMKTEEVTLDPIDWTDWYDDYHFTVNISNPNGGNDQYEYNNTMTSEFELSPEYENQFMIHFKTNKVAYQNRWEITDAEGNVVIEKDDFDNETLYIDTLLLDDGCYTFTLWDTGDNGISFWYHSGQGSGYCSFKRMAGTTLHYFNPDFGKFTSWSFTVGLSVNTHDLAIKDYIDVYPNPSPGNLNVAFALTDRQDVKVDIYSPSGMRIRSHQFENVDNDIIRLDLSAYPDGIYFCIIRTEKEVFTKKIILAR